MTPAERLRVLLERPGILVMPGCHDAMSARLIEGGKTPLLPPTRLEAIGYRIAVYPLTLLNVSIQAMRTALVSLARSERPAAAMEFEDLKNAVGFPAYYAEEARYGRGR